MLGLGETLARRRGLLRAMKSLRGLEDYYRRIVFSVADQTTPRDNRVDALTKPTITTPTRLRTALFTRLSTKRSYGRAVACWVGGWKRKLSTRSRPRFATPLLSCPLAGGTGSGAEQSRLLTRFRPSREYFIGSGCVRLLFVWAVSVRQRLALDCFGRFVPCTPQAPRMSLERTSKAHATALVALLRARMLAHIRPHNTKQQQI